MTDEDYAPVRICCGQKHHGALCPDGKVMCCVCFNRFEIDELNEDKRGVKENVCKRCAFYERAFHESLEKVSNYMDFSTALQHIRDGSTVTREGWNTEGAYLELQVPDEDSRMTEPYIVFCTNTLLIPWVASQTDLLAEDWEIV